MYKFPAKSQNSKSLLEWAFAKKLKLHFHSGPYCPYNIKDITEKSNVNYRKCHWPKTKNHIISLSRRSSLAQTSYPLTAAPSRRGRVSNFPLDLLSRASLSTLSRSVIDRRRIGDDSNRSVSSQQIGDDSNRSVSSQQIGDDSHLHRGSPLSVATSLQIGTLSTAYFFLGFFGILHLSSRDILTGHFPVPKITLYNPNLYNPQNRFVLFGWNLFCFCSFCVDSNSLSCYLDSCCFSHVAFIMLFGFMLLLAGYLDSCCF